MSNPALQHPIKVVAQRTGLTPHVIRAWEKRYATVQPHRSGGNQRLYREDDVQRLLLLRQATEAGHPIRTVAQLPIEKLREILSGSAEVVPTKPIPPSFRPKAWEPRSASKGAAQLIEEALEAIRKLDAAQLERVLDEASVSLGQVALLGQVIAPVVERVGASWEAGQLKVAHEHLASAVIRTFLGQAARPYAVHAAAPVLISTTPNGQLHELGAALAAAAASSHGWRVTYLGASLPAEEIVGAVEQNQARAVALSIVHPADDPELGTELRRLRRLLPSGVALLVGGRCAGAYAKDLRRANAMVCTSLTEFTAALDRLRQGEN